MNPSSTLPSPEELLPHAEPMILLDGLLSWDGTTARFSAKIRRGCPLVDRSANPAVLPATSLLEYLAQAAGCVSGLVQREKGNTVLVGYLLGTRELTLHVASLSVGDELELEAARLFGEDRLGSLHCVARRGNEVVAEATLNVLAGELESIAGGGKKREEDA